MDFLHQRTPILTPHDFLPLQEQIRTLCRLWLSFSLLHLLYQSFPIIDCVGLDPLAIVAIVTQPEHQFLVVICCKLLPFLFMNRQNVHRQGCFLDLLAEIIRLELFFPIFAKQSALSPELLDP